jgi:hypothetical protein
MLSDDIVAASTQVSIYRQLFFLTWVAAEDITLLQTRILVFATRYE